ncbi:MAG: glycosyltransferase family 4 protein [bacterium]|nr:glycosyltransferase family 4 protein [bacterium]
MEPVLKKKVLFVITKSNWGGAQRYVYDLATSLPKEKYENVVVLGGTGAMGSAPGELARKLSLKKVRTVFVKTFTREIFFLGEFKSLWELVKILRKERPDIIHLNSPKAAFLGSLASFLTNFVSHIPFLNTDSQTASSARVVFTVHGWPFKEKRGIFFRAVSFFGSWLSVFFSDRVIAVSKDDENLSPCFLTSKDKITLIRNGVRPQKFKKMSESREEMSDDKHGKETFMIGTLGELHKNKGLFFAIKAFADILKDKELYGLPYKHFVLVVVGEGEERQNLESQVLKYEIQDSVKFKGHMEEASVFLKGLDLFLFPSLKEGLPYAVLEAGAAGLPVVASSVGGIPEIITDMESGILVRPESAEELRSAIKFLILRKNHRKQFGAKLKEKIMSDFSFEEMLIKTVNVYDA